MGTHPSTACANRPRRWRAPAHRPSRGNGADKASRCKVGAGLVVDRPGLREGSGVKRPHQINATAPYYATYCFFIYVLFPQFADTTLFTWTTVNMPLAGVDQKAFRSNEIAAGELPRIGETWRRKLEQMS